MGAVESKTVSYNGQEITVSDLMKKASELENDLAKRKTEIENHLQTIQQATTDAETKAKKIEELTSDLQMIQELKNALEAEKITLTRQITDKDIAIGEKDLALSVKAEELTSANKLLKQTEDALNEMKAKYADSEKKLSQCEIDRKTFEDSSKKYKKRVDELDACNVSKTAAASAFRNLRAGYGPIKKMLWEHRNYWYMYIVENFNDKWKNDNIGKYLWNIAIHFKNNSAICIFSTQAGTLTPKDQHNNFYAMNWALVEAIKYSGTDYRSHNINKVFFNGVTAKKYTIKFWQGGHLQWETDADRSVAAHHENGGDDRHPNMNQTGQMWKWMDLTVNKGNAENDWEQKYNGRNYTMTANVEEGKVMDIPFNKYRFRDMYVSKLLFGDYKLKGPGISPAWVNINRWNFYNPDSFNAALEAPFILRLEIQDLNECNRALEGFCPYRRKRRNNFIQKLVITILIILAACFIYVFFFKKCNKNTEDDHEKGGYYTYYTE